MCLHVTSYNERDHMASSTGGEDVQNMCPDWPATASSTEVSTDFSYFFRSAKSDWETGSEQKGASGSW